MKEQKKQKKKKNDDEKMNGMEGIRRTKSQTRSDEQNKHTHTNK